VRTVSRMIARRNQSLAQCASITYISIAAATADATANAAAAATATAAAAATATAAAAAAATCAIIAPDSQCHATGTTAP
jgi:hypothetical protein